MFGYTGKILEVDLTTSKIKITNIDEKLFEKFIGGKGLGAKILYDSLKQGTEPLSPKNLLIFATGPLTGLPLPGSACFSVLTKLPLTNIFYSSTVRSNLGTKLKRAGFDALIIKGSSSSPVFLQIEDNDCKIIGALDLWRKNYYQTEKILKSELGRDFAIAGIGISGEKLVKFASINTDSCLGTSLGGDILGSKNLKAIAVNSKNKSLDYDFNKFKLIARKIFKKIRGYERKGYTTNETERKLLPSKNFQLSKEWDYTVAEKFPERVSIKCEGCYLCQLKCLKNFFAKNEMYKGKFSVFYPTLALLSSNWLISNPNALVHATYLCNDYGLEINNICNVIGFAMECSEKNLISEHINFGSETVATELIRRISRREGLGNELAEGIKIYTEKADAQATGAQIKGMELVYDARTSSTLALQYITSDTGGIHISQKLESKKDEAKFVKNLQDRTSIIDSLVMCGLLPLETNDFVELVNAATKLEFDESSFLKIGERVWNLTRLFNAREGISRKDDTLPKRFIEAPLPTTNGKLLRVMKDKIDGMLDCYYSLRGWNENGIPKKEKLIELELV